MEPWHTVSDQNRFLEGAIFDLGGNLIFCDVTGGRVLRLTPDKPLLTVVTLEPLAPGGLALHPDGRLFLAALNLDTNLIGFFAVNKGCSGLNGSECVTILPPGSRVSAQRPGD